MPSVRSGCLAALGGVFFALAGPGCSSAGFRSYDRFRAERTLASAAPARAPGSAALRAESLPPLEPHTSNADRTNPALADADEKRIVVYSANLNIVVMDIDRSIDAALSMAKELGGYMQSRHESWLVVRIPAAKFEQALARFEELGTVDGRQIEAQDVTEEFVDLDARLKAAQAVRERLLAVLADARKVEDTLAVEKELGRVNAEIDGLKAKLDVLRGRVAMSTLSLFFKRVARLPALGPGIRLPFAWLDELDLGRLVGQDELSPRYLKNMTMGYKGSF